MRDINKVVFNKLKKNVLKEEYIELGNNIKKTRKEKQFTQELLSNGICSVSYLSKIENAAVKPNIMYVEEMFERMDVKDKSIIPSVVYCDNLEDAISDMYFMNYGSLMEDYNFSKRLNNVIGRVMHYGSALFLNDVKSIVEEYEQLSYFIESMDEFTLKSYLVFSIILEHDRENYLEALKLIQTCQLIHTSNEKLEGLFHLFAFKVHGKLKKTSLALHHYNAAKKISNENLSFYYYNSLEMDYIAYLIEEDVYYARMALDSLNVDTIGNNIFKARYKYFEALLYFNSKQYDECIRYINSLKKEDFYEHETELLLFKAYHAIKNKEEEQKLYDKLYAECSDPSPHLIIMGYLLLGKNKTHSEIVGYITKTAFPYFFGKQDVKNIDYFVYELVQVYANNSRYKYGIEALKKRNKFLAKIDKIIQQRQH